MQLKTNPQIDPLKKQVASKTTKQVKQNPTLDALNKQAASTTTKQVNKNSQLDALKKQAASTTIKQVNINPQFDALNKRLASRTTMQLKTKPQLDAIKKQTASTTTKQLKKNPKLNPLNKQAQSSEKNIPPKKKNDRGFTLVELTIVLMIITILSAIALPSFVGCHKAKQSEAKQYAGSMNRAQQAYFAEKGAFSNSLTALGLGIKTQTTNYNYSIGATKNTAFSYAVSRSERHSIRSYVGAVFLVPDSQAAKNKNTTASILCETNALGKNIQPSNPLLQNDVPVCGDGTVEVSK